MKQTELFIYRSLLPLRIKEREGAMDSLKNVRISSRKQNYSRLKFLGKIAASIPPMLQDRCYLEA